MHYRLLILFTVFISGFAEAQTELEYITYAKFNDSAFNTKIKDLYKVEFGKDIDMTDTVVQKLLFFMKEGTGIIREKMKNLDTLRIKLRNDTVIFNSLHSTVKGRTGKAYLSLKSTELIHVYKNMSEEYIQIDTSKLIQSDYQYLINETHYDSLILRLKCKKILIEEYFTTNQKRVKNRSFIIWATKEIYPIVPLYSVLWLHDKILLNWTPFCIEEITENPYPSTLFTNIILVKAPNIK